MILGSEFSIIGIVWEVGHVGDEGGSVAQALEPIPEARGDG